MNNTSKKIEYYLYNYENIDTKICNLKSEMLDSEYNQSYNRWIKNKSSSLEDQVIRNIGIEQRIYKITRWKKLITYTMEWYKYTKPINYQFINLKYIKKASYMTIQKELNLSIKEQKYIQAEILQYIFFVAIKKGILREVNY